MTAAYTYMLECADGSLYTGWTTDVKARLAVHNAGLGARYTRSRLPVKLAYVECQPDQSAARKREAAIKKLTRKQKEALILSHAANRQETEGRDWTELDEVTSGQG